MDSKKVTRRQLLKVLLGLPFLGVVAAAASPLLRLLKPFGKLGLEVPPPAAAVTKLSTLNKPVGDSFVKVPAVASELEPMIGYSFEVITEDRSIPYKPVKIREPGILIKDNDGKFRAWNAKCTHLGCVVRWSTSKNEWHCRCHDGFFDPLMKEVLGGPPPKPLNPWTVRVDGETIIIDKETPSEVA